MSMSLDTSDMSTGFNPLSAAGPSISQTTMASPDGGQRFSMSGTEDNGPGSGPLPVSTFGSQQGHSGGSTLTEFTKRRNWAAKVVEELKDFLQILDAHGRIKQVSPSITALTGYSAEDVLERFLKDFIHPDDNGVFVSELNESIATGNPLRLFYRLKKKDGNYAIFESIGHGHIAAAKFAPNPNNQSPFCQAVFMMSRPYPTKNASLLDSFLEHKIENERLKRRIAELRKEEAEDADEAQRMWRQSQEARSDITMSEDAMGASNGGGNSSYSQFNPAMPPPERPASINASLTRENLEGSIAGGRTDTIRDKMARYEGSSHADTIEMLTGLRYQEGERSKGITTGNASPTLIKGDAGIAIPVDRDPRTGEKKKKLKVAEEYVCTDCGTFRGTTICLSTFLTILQVRSTRPNGGKDPVAQRRSVTRVVFAGLRKRRRGTRTASVGLLPTKRVRGEWDKKCKVCDMRVQLVSFKAPRDTCTRASGIWIRGVTDILRYLGNDRFLEHSRRISYTGLGTGLVCPTRIEQLTVRNLIQVLSMSLEQVELCTNRRA